MLGEGNRTVRTAIRAVLGVWETGREGVKVDLLAGWSPQGVRAFDVGKEGGVDGVW